MFDLIDWVCVILVEIKCWLLLKTNWIDTVVFIEESGILLRDNGQKQNSTTSNRRQLNIYGVV